MPLMTRQYVMLKHKYWNVDKHFISDQNSF